MNLTQILNAGEAGLGALKSLGGPIGVLKTASNLSLHVPPVSGLGSKLLKRLNWAEGPPEIAALMADALALGRLLYQKGLSESAGKITELAVSILKKCCTIFQWLDQRHLVSADPSDLGPIQGVSNFCDVMGSSVELWQNFLKLSSERQVLSPALKFLKANLQFYVYLSDNKQLNIIVTGLGVAADGYDLYQKCKKIPLNPKEWTITIPPMGQIISIIALGALALYVIEKKVESENLQ
ncbi:MAG: hypothetical protein JSS10_01890 [Verrucomicrobia bacterium]|nr:hypothetical protein [Verrucomicrobiota bacterium]